MSMTPLERVARAICEKMAPGDTEEEISDCVENTWRDFVDAAQLAIVALAGSITDEIGTIARTEWYRRPPCHPEDESRDMRNAVRAAILSTLGDVP